MKGRTLIRHGKEGVKSLARNGWMTFASISAVAIMLLMVGVFLLLILNLNHFATSVEEDVEVRVFIDLTATEEQREELLQEIEQIHNVESITFLPKEEGLEQFIDSLGEQGEVFETLRDENPLYDVFVVRAVTPQLTEEVATNLEPLPYVVEVGYGKDVVDQLFSFTSLARQVGFFLIVGLMFTTMFLIANTIKITIVARKREIKIMKLVGATNSFIRWPFFVEGLLLGVLGALIPIGILAFGYSKLHDSFTGNLDLMFIELLPSSPLVYQVTAILLAIGAFIGIWGSMMSVRKFLKV
ncbi:cell division protein FtsX [Anaerobacillus alkalidiazotrophicus]|uniref:Cell division protein FtsX n=1 Tax=Anaerobacillus alkalidiazotrophicus TaxID=472963 RepID=A0A1S2M8T2_9BACI|nr:permease-like cell division protein FtsX [Anaerobacillus alkalidiazotrophicus]OIJ21006.1 cell division protein FtsX [Anaerobacillus alkalidiazotrophicus]